MQSGTVDGYLKIEYFFQILYQKVRTQAYSGHKPSEIIPEAFL